jgi:uncharacterized protein (DUF885 family)
MRRQLLALAAITLVSCTSTKTPKDFSGMTRDFVESTLALAPVTATSVGYHKHGEQALDTLLDDYSEAGVQRQRKHWTDWRTRLDAIDAATLDAESRADLGLMKSQAALALLELDRIKGWQRNPTVYVELLGNALFTPYSVEYAPAADRYRHIIGRLKATPAFVDAAKANLKSAPPVWKRVAIEENDGTIALMNGPLLAGVPAELKAEYEQAAKPAVGALTGLNGFIGGLKDEGEEAWRLGEELYRAKFQLALGGARSPAVALSEAEADLKAVRKRMFELSLPLHKRFYPTHRDPVDLNLIVGEVMDKLAQRHVSREGYTAEARKTLEETRAFLAANSAKLVAPPPRDNLTMIDTPEFMRGIYSTGGFNPAPPLEPQLGAFYWLTPIPASWPKERIESKLREYNEYGLRILTIHEAIPGHYAQFEYASMVEPAPRRLLRSIFGSNVYVEGWAVYATDVMLAAGYHGNSPEMQMTFMKQLLRAIANTILDIRLHTLGMTREEALDLMVSKTFQEKEEAAAKWQRAQLSVCQLPTYYAGYKEWKQLRAEVEARQGTGFSASAFHEKALRAGALPVKSIRTLFGLDAAPAPAK